MNVNRMGADMSDQQRDAIAEVELNRQMRAPSLNIGNKLD